MGWVMGWEQTARRGEHLSHGTCGTNRQLECRGLGDLVFRVSPASVPNCSRAS